MHKRTSSSARFLRVNYIYIYIYIYICIIVTCAGRFYEDSISVGQRHSARGIRSRFM